MISRRTLIAGLVLTGTAAEAARAAERMPQAYDIPFATWTDDEPLYLFYPGDKLEIVVPSAPELNRQTQIGPDGRITLALIGQVMAAYHSVPDLQAMIAAKYAQILRDPTIFVYPGDTTPMRVLVGGEVRNPGWVDMMADMDALQATLAAGGFTDGAKRDKVMLIRRGRNGGAMQRIIDLKTPLKGKAGKMVALRRFDILYVPRSAIAEAGVFMNQWVNNLIPGGVQNYFMYQAFN
ncbi:polysaccharide biosynthesis/export family protein [Asticcacaulis biprosthecium C19]|uniref:Polysaccharide biosynthesis/export family protein n=1 Tax=Asticcacaulis biprosthecium C19 TaxID=715226 RepID=F4QSW7_9CAUL|nr:polysaccharide biosynthesis/export family protein [Asticcacaulis biprosthecium]EGF89837.1 polysaccharide biosynthesis/export family protein [Asticcacaulis biprosthecium C19]